MIHGTTHADTAALTSEKLDVKACLGIQGEEQQEDPVPLHLCSKVTGCNLLYSEQAEEDAPVWQRPPQFLPRESVPIGVPFSQQQSSRFNLIIEARELIDEYVLGLSLIYIECVRQRKIPLKFRGSPASPREVLELATR